MPGSDLYVKRVDDTGSLVFSDRPLDGYDKATLTDDTAAALKALLADYVKNKETDQAFLRAVGDHKVVAGPFLYMEDNDEADLRWFQISTSLVGRGDVLLAGGAMTQGVTALIDRARAARSDMAAAAASILGRDLDG